MSDTKDMSLTHNELEAIAHALNIQIDMCNDTISDPRETFGEKAAANEAMRYSKSALQKVEFAIRNSRR